MPPTAADAENIRGLRFAAEGRMPEAVEAFQQAIQIDPKNPGYYANLGNAIAKSGDPNHAVAALRRGISVDPTFATLHGNLALVLRQMGRVDDAIDAATEAVHLQPDHASYHYTLADALQGAGDLDGAILETRETLRLDPNHTNAADNLAFAANFHWPLTPRDILDFAVESSNFRQLRGARPITPNPNNPDPNRRLKIGYVSPMFYRQAEAFFVIPLLEHHDRSHFEIHCFSTGTHADEITDRHRRAADHWHEISALDDNVATSLILGHGIDILVDLAMHLPGNRLGIFAQRAAPIQMTWLAYPGTTGLDSIDCRITDPIIDPPGADEFYSERSIRLPTSWICYDPLCDLPPRVPSARTSISFGSLNNPMKISEPLVRLWGRILQRVPDSRLALLSHSQRQRAGVVKILSEMGISRERIGFSATRPREQYLRIYDLIDIALDTFPYNGITTSCDSLWMSVPVVTMTGKTASGRASASMLAAAGLPELVGDSHDAFVEIAVALAQDPSRLRAYHASLREKVTASPLMDGKHFAVEMERAYRNAWRQRCQPA